MSTNQEDRPTTLILRFRDLVTARGETIKEHQEISSAKDYAWWGWWNKGGEAIPDEVFRELKRQAPIEIFLMDSGQQKLYKARCLGIEWKATHDRIEPPEAGAYTPEYYKSQEYLAWFQLADFEEVAIPEEVLHGFSYIRVDAFFNDRPSRFKAFYGKRVHSIEELRQQERTIWFVRPFKSGDPTHEVNLLDARSTSPQHFPNSYFSTKSTHILWASDVHFSVDGCHRFPLSSDSHKFELGHQIERAFKDKVEELAGLIISGDFAWKADKKEFEQAKQFIKRINSWSPLSPDQIAICPGNHDIRFSENPAEKGIEIGDAPADAREAYSKFYEDLFYLAPNAFLSSGTRILVGNAIPVDIISLNSSLLEQYPGAFQGHGFIGQEQMRHAAKQMNWSTQQQELRAFRIAVVHHHVLPVTFSAEPKANYPYSVALDAEAFIRWIVEHRVNLVLHGHMHQPAYARLSRAIKQGGDKWHSFYVVGMGSTGVEALHLGEIQKNTVGLLSFGAEELEIAIHSIHPTTPSQPEWTVRVPLKG